MSTLKGMAEDEPVKGTKKELSAFEENQEGFILASKREESSKKGGEKHRQMLEGGKIR